MVVFARTRDEKHLQMVIAKRNHLPWHNDQRDWNTRSETANTHTHTHTHLRALSLTHTHPPTHTPVATKGVHQQLGQGRVAIRDVMIGRFFPGGHVTQGGYDLAQGEPAVANGDRAGTQGERFEAGNSKA
jgi:hypothetical protein